MHGSLLILTCDSFSSDENLVLGIVAGTDNVKNGILEITIIQGDLKPGNFSESFSVIFVRSNIIIQISEIIKSHKICDDREHSILLAC